MTAVSPKPSSPGTPIVDWDEAQVNAYFVSLGLKQYESVIYEHGITGEVLCALDNETLVDLGMMSLGHRLNVLRAVFELKKEQGVEIGEDDWRPQEEVALEAMETAATIDRMWSLVLDQQERLQSLEKEQIRLMRALTENGIQLPPPPPTLVEVSGTPTAGMGAYFGSPPPTSHGKLQTSKPPLARLASGTVVRSGSRSQRNDGASTAPLPSSPTPPVEPAPAPSGGSSHGARDAAHSAARSFRVTMEDPCWKVLPAALKKYKINDDWKMYALFICYGNTERCLSYDEKPLLLFQKLKEGGQRPVFMLRHIRDIKSPIAVAQQKQAIKLGLPANSTANLLPQLDAPSPSPTKATRSPGAAKSESGGRTPGDGTFPELPSPGMRDPDAATIASKDFKENSSASSSIQPRTPVTGTLMDKDGKVHKVTYAISIYPYIADRQDEFDVAVGAAFVVMSKAKGWWFVLKDTEGRGNISSETTKSAWVPAGCLLELTAPIASISPQSPGSIPGRAPIPPANIMSSSYPGVVLMNHTSKDTHELTIKEGEKVRVYKKYCHWSYSIKEDTGERGWVPAWFVGKLTGAGEREAAAPSASGSAPVAGAGAGGSGEAPPPYQKSKEEGEKKDKDEQQGGV
ncbi:hypothetical protein CC85DRAFT_308208 [Cutaneotrichosporon oleaginosum]|uniref:RA-domain-containing protein n=1 Tax=Cutaneotrichosporon oleaginosum TaxID=879819 RepID=A0A0J0XLP9_9TREE|nr:uncharacterized protein CC85DRAFT_308208 [Cutaneotrichosporon oleaginosum]KLT42051.1 hypothetical protein CC85DRAFT_308208 [Cutaneotrichosporon oleaginosum]TXT04710.1 hypothetical protein COLE_07529 [Cutaneotrichosporon oleaginosum]